VKKIRAFIVDDSAVVREMVSRVLNADPGIEVIGMASDPLFAMDKMMRDWPDVIVLDIEMPRMDGLTFLRKIMAERPTPVVICSTLSQKGADETFEALALGAVACVGKPRDIRTRFVEDAAGDLLTQVKTASLARLRARPHTAQAFSAAVQRSASPDHASAPVPAECALTPQMAARKQVGAGSRLVVAVGASTGGTEALEYVLRQLPTSVPGIVIVQHMPEQFTAAFAKRLNRVCDIEVQEAVSGMEVVTGRAIIARGGRQLAVRKGNPHFYVDVLHGPFVNRHRPSVDFMFRSAAAVAGANCFGVIMTGMGNDGAAGLLRIRQIGGRTIGQSEESCVVYGMPKEALKLGGVERVVHLDDIAGEISALSVRLPL
jgi:two-component system chemotaxis response regulator CheB